MLRPPSTACASLWTRRASSCRSPAPASRPNAAFRISVRPAASGPRCGRSSSSDFLASQEMRDESLAAALRHGGAVRRRQARPRPPGAGLALPGRQDRPAWSLRTSTICTRPLALRPNTWSSCTATPPTRPASTARSATNCPGSSRVLRRERARAGVHVCGGHIKTATVSFGQAMPEQAMRRAQELTRVCDLFLAIGSSLVVWPAAGFPLVAKRNGARLVIINRDRDRVRRHRRPRGASRHRRRCSRPSSRTDSLKAVVAQHDPRRCAQLATACQYLFNWPYAGAAECYVR